MLPGGAIPLPTTTVVAARVEASLPIKALAKKTPAYYQILIPPKYDVSEMMSPSQSSISNSLLELEQRVARRSARILIWLENYDTADTNDHASPENGYHNDRFDYHLLKEAVEAWACLKRTVSLKRRCTDILANFLTRETLD